MNVVTISAEAFLLDMFCKHSEHLPHSVLKHIAKVIDYSIVPERAIAEKEEIRNVVHWDKLEKMKLIRVFIRCLDLDIDVLDKIKPSLDKFDYKIKEMLHLLGRRPHYIQYFPIEVSEITTSEAALILSLGHDFFLDKIDFSKYKFNFRESMEIIQGYKYKREIIEQVNYKSLKGSQISEILGEVGERDLDILDISALTNMDWINLLSLRPEMLKYCDYNKFMRGDIFYSIRLCCMFDTPDLSYLVTNRDMNSISPFGWEKLIIEKPEIFLAHCDFSKLDDNNWKNIMKEYPKKYLCSIKDKYHIYID